MKTQKNSQFSILKSQITSHISRISYLCLLIACYFLLFTAPVSAHVLTTSGSIGAVLHIDPEDDPIIGQPAGFFFDFKDKTGKFDPKNCDCTFIVLENGQQKVSQNLFQNTSEPSLTSAAVFYTFPQKDIYTVQVIGKPKTPGQFEPFTLSYDLRVTRVPSSPPPQTTSNTVLNWTSNHIPHLIGAIIISVFFIGALIKQSLSKP